ncbi:DNA primase [Micromonospora sp. MH33]|uniref:DNA primase n=1 Tax=Micromonospora sp. MH33 TaxID=1945509 RepID=UPI000D1481BE|nr:DNA primase [Micromonospora sp. MH33]PSK62232.1 DNA primase [Micromonospora sp. MH33]
MYAEEVAEMAGRIRDEDIALVRERTSIAEVISDTVTLKSAGGGNLKGLCPFHDEKSPSFNVSPARNVWYCFGCGAGGDAIKFLMDAEHLSFVESVERLAARAGIQLRYVEDDRSTPRPRPQQGQRQRLVAAHAAAVDFYRAQLSTAGARRAREFLAERGFDRAAAERYGCGFAPDAWDLLTKHLRQQGFTHDELVTAGLSRPSRSGSLIDRFRRRLLWPIRDLTGDVIGFGARKLFDDDDGPKYLNTPETPIYKKSHVLYGIDQAKREIAKQGKVVVVEGYTDVMACHLAGVPTAVATCGTAFGADHIKVLRRLILDSSVHAGAIIYTFDGDAAGQKAAMRAFEDDQEFLAQTFIAVSPNNMDPCELRLEKGDLAVRDLVASREPLLTYAIRSIAGRYDLELAEGRTAAMQAIAPLMLKIRRWDLREQYLRELAKVTGVDPEDVRAVLKAVDKANGHAVAGLVQPAKNASPTVDSPRSMVEREALKLALQQPVLAGPMFDAVEAGEYRHPLHVAARTAIAMAGGTAGAASGAVWIEQVRDACDDLAGKALIGELAVEPLRIDGEPDLRYVSITMARLQWGSVTGRIRDLKAKIQRINPVSNKDEYFALFGELLSLEQHARALREQAAGE